MLHVSKKVLRIWAPSICLPAPAVFRTGERTASHASFRPGRVIAERQTRFVKVTWSAGSPNANPYVFRSQRQMPALRDRERHYSTPR